MKLQNLMNPNQTTIYDFLPSRADDEDKSIHVVNSTAPRIKKTKTDKFIKRYRIAVSADRRDEDVPLARGLTWDEYSIDQAYRTYRKEFPNCVIVEVSSYRRSSLEDLKRSAVSCGLNFFVDISKHYPCLIVRVHTSSDHPSAVAAADCSGKYFRWVSVSSVEEIENLSVEDLNNS